MKRKTNKKSGIIAAVVGLSAVSLVSVGFASWVMSGGDSVELTGDISVETVTDQRYFIYKKSDLAVDYGNTKKAPTIVNNEEVYEQATSICFGIDDSTTIDDAWLTAAASGNNYENLTASVEFYVANLDKPAGNHLTVGFAATGDKTQKTGYYAAVDHGYVGDLPTPTVTLADSTTNLDTTDPNKINFRKVTISIEFEWGATFGNVNPYKYYNADGKTVSGYVDPEHPGQTWGDHARQHLLQLRKDLSGVKFTLTITTSANDSNSGN